MDEAPHPEVVATFSELCERATTEGRTLLVDLQKVRSMSSVMAGRLVLLKKISKQNEVDVRLINLSDQLLAVMQLTRLDRLFQFGER